MSIQKAQERIEAAEREIVEAKAELTRAVNENARVGFVKPENCSSGFVVSYRNAVTGSSGYSFDAYACGLWYPTRKVAEIAARRARLTVKLKERIHEYNDGWVPDWSDANQKKCYLRWRYGNECASTGFTWRVRDQADGMYFKSGNHNNFGFAGAELCLIITGKEL